MEPDGSYCKRYFEDLGIEIEPMNFFWLQDKTSGFADCWAAFLSKPQAADSNASCNVHQEFSNYQVSNKEEESAAESQLSL